MDGFQVTAAIRALPDAVKAGLPIIAMTAHALKEDIANCLSAGMDAHISKPIQAEEFLELVEFLGEPGADPNQRRRSMDSHLKEPMGASEVPLQDGLHCMLEMPAFDFNEGVRRCFGKQDLFQEMVDCFLCETDGMLHSMWEAFQQGDVRAILDLAHRMKNTVIYLGAQPAASAIAEVEAATKSGKPNVISVALDNLDRQLRTLNSALLIYRHQDSMNSSHLS
jgi:CheY-like chemotaxis protein